MNRQWPHFEEGERLREVRSCEVFEVFRSFLLQHYRHHVALDINDVLTLCYERLRVDLNGRHECAQSGVLLECNNGI